MDKPTLFTINIIETREDPEFDRAYNDYVLPTNRVYASYEDAYCATLAMAQKKTSELSVSEENIQPTDDGFVLIMPWDNNEQDAFVVRELEWE
jgi:hypothetical protein